MPKYLVPIDLTQNELQNARVQNLGSAPGSPVEGQIYHNSATHRTLVYDGTTWQDLMSSSISPALTGDVTTDGVTNVTSIATGVIVNADISASAAIALSKLATDPLDRANHTGAQAISTVTSLQATLDAKLALAGGTMSGAIAMGTFKITGLGTPTAGTDAATMAYVDAAVQGLDIKASARVATTANITLSGAQTIDGISAIAGNRVLVKNQSTASQNGIYVVAAGAWSRATDADTDAEVTTGLYVFVSEGTVNNKTGWVLSTADAIVLGTTSLTFTQFNGAGTYTNGTGLSLSGNTFSIDTAWAGQAAITTLGTIVTGTWQGTAVALGYGGTGGNSASAARTNLNVPSRYAVSIGDGVTTSHTVTHNLGTQDVEVQVYEVGSPYNKVYPDIRMTSSSVCTVIFTTAPTSNQYRVVVVG